MLLGQVLRDRQTGWCYEQEAVAVLPLLHLIAGTHPAPAVLLQLSLLVRIEVAWAQRATHLLQVGSKPLDNCFSDNWVGVARGPRLLPVLLDVLRDALH